MCGHRALTEDGVWECQQIWGHIGMHFCKAQGKTLWWKGEEFLLVANEDLHPLV
jgi:hypothetical protein